MWHMTALFGGRQRRRDHEPTLSELPAWGLEIMMGLYGPETIQRECAQEDAPEVRASVGRAPGDRPQVRAVDERSDAATPPPPMSPIVVELEAMNELVKYLERKLKRH